MTPSDFLLEEEIREEAEQVSFFLFALKNFPGMEASFLPKKSV